MSEPKTVLIIDDDSDYVRAIQALLESSGYKVRSATNGRDGLQLAKTGLGLVICRRIVDELGGSIEVDSKEGEYTVFTVKLPVAQPRQEFEGSEAVGK